MPLADSLARYSLGEEVNAPTARPARRTAIPAAHAVWERIWALLEQHGVAQPGVRGYISAFTGADAAAERLTTLAAWESARNFAWSVPVAGTASPRGHETEEPVLDVLDSGGFPPRAQFAAGPEHDVQAAAAAPVDLDHVHGLVEPGGCVIHIALPKCCQGQIAEHDGVRLRAVAQRLCCVFQQGLRPPVLTEHGVRFCCVEQRQAVQDLTGVRGCLGCLAR